MELVEKQKMRKLSTRFCLLTVFVISLCGQSFAQSDAPLSRNDWRGHLELARKAYKDKQYNSALLHYQNAQLGLPKDVDIQEELAQTEYRLNALDQAAKRYQEKVKSSPQALGRAQRNLGNIAMQQKSYKNALQHYSESLKADPNNRETQYNLSQAIRALKQAEKNPPPPSPNKPEPPKDPEKQPENKEEQEQDATLSDRSVERLLKKLMKQEAETKRKLANGKAQGNNQRLEKDW
jgi:tetratricopeptide (TPR) repeat protein